jgi:hypothetical protein
MKAQRDVGAGTGVGRRSLGGRQSTRSEVSLEPRSRPARSARPPLGDPEGGRLVDHRG